MKSIEAYIRDKYREVVETKLAQEGAVALSRPTNVGLGLIFLVSGIIFLGFVIMATINSTGSGNIVVGYVVPLVFIVTGAALVLYRTDYWVNFGQQTWTCEFGLRPFSQKYRGTFQDLSHLDFGLEQLHIPGSRSKSQQFWTVAVVAQDSVIPRMRVEFMNGLAAVISRTEALRVAEILSLKMNLPVQEHEGTLVKVGRRFPR